MRTVLFLALAAFTVGGCGDPEPMPVSATQVGQNFVISYGGKAFIGTCTLAINKKYRVKIHRIEGGKSVTVPIFSFVDNRGKRFNQYTVKLTSFYIVCDERPGKYDNLVVFR